MILRTRWMLVALLCLGVSIARAQRMGMGMGQAPHIPGAFKPVVGSGAEYEISTADHGKMKWVYAVVGKEDVEGGTGYWLEMRQERGDGEGVIMKQLMVMKGDEAGIERMIMQVSGQPPMEMPAAMMKRMSPGRPEQAPKQGTGEKVGTESLTVPAGTFTCEHYRNNVEGKVSEVWASAEISPYGLIKMTSEGTSMVLLKVLKNETSHIKGEPQKMQFPKY